MKPRASSAWRCITLLLLVSAALTPVACAGYDLLPVSAAQKGFTPAQIASIRSTWTWQDLFIPGNSTLYALLHFSDFYPSAVISRAGPSVPLETSLDPAIPVLRWKTALGDLALADYLASPAPRVQGFIVIHHGRIAYESYPGMRDTDSHVAFSVGKPAISLVIALLESDGKVDVLHTIGSYVPALRGTAWADIKVIDVLNMSSGLDIRESRLDPSDYSSNFARLVHSIFGAPGRDGKVETQLDVLRGARRVRPPREEFEYSSLNSQVLVMVAEAVARRPWAQIFQSRVWSRLYAEDDARVMLAPDGIAVPAGFLSLRLRDLARFGMLYTPSWSRAARQRVVTDSMVTAIQSFPSLRVQSVHGEVVAHSSRQWDYVFPNGDFYKSGIFCQGLYISPGKDVVIAWFSTAASNGILGYARSIAHAFSAP